MATDTDKLLFDFVKIGMQQSGCASKVLCRHCSKVFLLLPFLLDLQIYFIAVKANFVYLLNTYELKYTKIEEGTNGDVLVCVRQPS